MKRPRTACGLLFVVLGLLTVGCAARGTETDNPSAPKDVELKRSSLSYLTNLTVAASDQEAVRQGERAFALDLYRRSAAAAAANDNLCIAAHSVATVLTMTSAGARGDTEAELATVLKHGLSPATLHPAMSQLEQQLRASLEGSAVTYQAVNSLWLDRQYQLEQPFLDVLSQYYDTGVYSVNFATNADSARQSINAWIADQTRSLIPELFSADALNSATEFVLTNAAYLSAPWQDRFDPATTSPAEFALEDGTVVDVDMMARQWQYPFALDVDWRALELPFAQANMGMVFVLPNEGEFTQLESSFDAALLDRIVSRLDDWQPTKELVYVRVPRFNFASSIDLKPVLEGLGATTFFDPATANFTGIDAKSGLYADGLLHRTTIGVDENGVTLAAATGEVMVPLPITPNIFLDRPFLFFIYDHSTNTVLFAGRLMRPAGVPHAPAKPPVVQTDIEAICSNLALCTARTTTEADCQSALAAGDAVLLEQCADCIRVAAACYWTESCGGFNGNLCGTSVCADYCPAHAF